MVFPVDIGHDLPGLKLWLAEAKQIQIIFIFRGSLKMKSLAITLSSLALVACGGGGGGGSTASTAAAITTATLSSSNQTVVAQEALSGATAPLAFGQGLVGAQTVDKSILFGVVQTALDNMPLYLANAKADSSLIGATSSRTTNCSVSGSTTITFLDADNNGIVSAGDSANFVENSCNNGQGVTTGTMSVSFSSITGTYGIAPYSMGVTLSFSGFTLATTQYSAGMTGSLSLSANVVSANSITQTLSAPSLTMSFSFAGGAVQTSTLSSYQASSTKSPDATYGYVRSSTVSGTITSSVLSSQSVVFSTPTALVTRGTDGYPSTGVLLISGASNTKLKLTAQSNTRVLQELDANGDGNFESSSTVFWNTLL